MKAKQMIILCPTNRFVRKWRKAYWPTVEHGASNNSLDWLFANEYWTRIKNI